MKLTIYMYRSALKLQFKLKSKNVDEQEKTKKS